MYWILLEHNLMLFLDKISVFFFSLSFFCDLKVTKVSCGQNHCLAIVKDSVSNTITAWCWGDNNFGQLGLGLNIKRRNPTLINTLLEYNSVPFDVSCGKNFWIITCMIITIPFKRIIRWICRLIYCIFI